MRDKMVKVGLVATAVALVSGTFGGVALAGDERGPVIHHAGNGGAGGNASADCGVSAQLPILNLLNKTEFAPQCDGWGGQGGGGGPVS
jgi:hypothetical protein